MLDALPVEILQLIIGHLPTAASVINLSLGNSKLHKQISADKYALFKSFVQARFPSVQTCPFWCDAAIALTCRSRAWDRRAFVARECRLPGDDVFPGTRAAVALKTGFVPALDSYDAWTGSSWAEKKEVLALGAAGRLRLRTTHNGKVSWSTYRTPFDHAPQNDILDVRVLRPHQTANLQNETVVLRRANNSVVKIVSKSRTDSFDQVSAFTMGPETFPIDCMDLSKDAEPLLAVCNSKEIRLYDGASSKTNVNACDVLNLEQHPEHKGRIRCAKFLSPTRFAQATQYLDGNQRAPIQIYQVSPSGFRKVPTHLRDETCKIVTGRHCANAIAPLDATSCLTGRPGDVFLSGWTDGVTRLYDLRSNTRPEVEYHDTVDDGQILSLLAIGHEKFLAGSHHNACLKTFDLRMSGGRAYSYASCPIPDHRPKPTPELTHRSKGSCQTHRDMNIFLALKIPRARRMWEPLPLRPNANMPRYRGSVYSLSSPSASSPTVYAGIENHVIQLDFVSTDDVRNSLTDRLSLGLSNQDAGRRPVLNLSCYERPQAGYESSDSILLRKQCDVAGYFGPGKRDQVSDAGLQPGQEEGWDERWRLSRYDRTEHDLAWR